VIQAASLDARNATAPATSSVRGRGPWVEPLEAWALPSCPSQTRVLMVAPDRVHPDSVGCQARGEVRPQRGDTGLRR
jgi:hypothetical protein